MKKPLKTIGLTMAGLLVVALGLLAWSASKLSPDLELGMTAADVSVTTADGEALAISSLRGKVVLLDFWSSS
ncbi:MAG: cytochrome oxidase Cu insertion factor (SCO1/SenC/PrrC family) [Pseudohongiellaceae bacterium]|jgi:cytochrome oxidase Cu insertion factor (SCO1/SenC/PrrC family)